MCDRSLYQQVYYENIKGAKLKLTPPFMIVLSSNFNPADIMKKWLEQALVLTDWNQITENSSKIASNLINAFFDRFHIINVEDALDYFDQKMDPS